jgi:hypothetical protein
MPHHTLTHDVMMGLLDVRGLAIKVDVRIRGARPRPEIQPIGKYQGRQRQVLAAQHG